MTRAGILAVVLAACSGSEDGAPDPVAVSADPVPAVEVPAEIAWRLPAREGRVAAPLARTAEARAARDRLAEVVDAHARDPSNPWAVGHALLVSGSDLTLTNGAPAVDWLFTSYASLAPVDGATWIAFPTRRGPIRIEPHSDLLLDKLVEAGVAPDREVLVGGERHPVSDLWRHSLAHAWVDGHETSYADWNDTPWALRGLATWAPEGLAWTAVGGHPMTMDAFTHAVVEKLEAETSFLARAIASGTPVQKRGQGIFAYTCGGAHLLQGAAYAVGRGFGEAADRDVIAAQAPILHHRLGLELAQVDAAIAQHPDYTVVLLEQRLKFLGHFLESASQLEALGFYAPDDAARAELKHALDQLVATVTVLERMGVLDRLGELRASNEQVYLDFVGDAAHAVHGIDLATGAATVRY